MTLEPIQPSNEQLFHSWLDATRVLQQEAFKVDYSRFEDPAALITYIKDMYIAAVQELGELLDETTWKPWAADEPAVNRTLVIKEAVDALHFIANILCAVQATDTELSDAYNAKMQVNRARALMPGGYKIKDPNNVVKCVNCTRSFDDVGRADVLDDICTICAGLSKEFDGGE